MNKESSLEIHMLFGALTRPAMTGGVTLDYHLINIIVSMCTFIMLNNLLYLSIFIPIHLFGVAVCRYDSHFFILCSKRFFMLPRMINHSIWGVRAYEPY